MTEETTQEAVDTVEADGNVQISVEQILKDSGQNRPPAHLLVFG